MQIKKVKKDKENGEITVDFVKNGKKGSFKYGLVGEERGIIDCDYEEDVGEDIYQEIHEWVEKKVKVKTGINIKK